jgi:hypothetical protein
MSNNNFFENNDSNYKDSNSEVGRHEKTNSENRFNDFTQNLKKKFSLKFNMVKALTKNSKSDLDLRDRSKFLMSRMNWLIVLKNIFEHLKERFVNVTPQLVIGALNLNRNDLEKFFNVGAQMMNIDSKFIKNECLRLPEDEYYQNYSEIGFNIEEILASISIITSTYITYDDLFNVVGRLNKEIATKSVISQSISIKKWNVSSFSSISFMTDNSEHFEKSILKSETKLNDTSMKETDLHKQLSNNVRSSGEHTIETARFNKIDPNPNISPVEEDNKKSINSELNPEFPQKSEIAENFEKTSPKIIEKIPSLSSSEKTEIGKLGSLRKSPNFSANSDETINISSTVSKRQARILDSSNSKNIESSDKNIKNIRIFNENKESSEKKSKAQIDQSSSPLSFNISAIKPNESLSPKTFTLTEFGNDLFDKNEKIAASKCNTGILSNEKREKIKENTETVTLKKNLFHLPIEKIHHQKNNVERIVEGMRDGSKKELIQVLRAGKENLALIQEDAIKSLVLNRAVNGMAKELFHLINVSFSF